MSIQSITKKRVAAAVATLSIGGAGLVMSGFGGESSMQVNAGKAGKPGEQQAATVNTASDDTIKGDRVRLVARRTGSRRFTLGWATPANGWLMGSATEQGSTATNEAGTAIGEPVSQTNDRVGRPRGTRMPRRVEITLPSHEGGRAPSATAPTVDRGTTPSVEPGWKTTIDLGEAPHVGRPSVDPGEMGTVYRPTVNVS